MCDWSIINFSKRMSELFLLVVERGGLDPAILDVIEYLGSLLCPFFKREEDTLCLSQ